MKTIQMIASQLKASWCRRQVRRSRGLRRREGRLTFESLEVRDMFAAAVDPGVIVSASVNDWYLNLDADREHEIDLGYGFPTDQFVAGNWNATLPTSDFPGVARNLSNGALCWALDRDGDPDDESRFCFGLVGDTARVADFNGDGFDDVAAIRPSNVVDPNVGRQPLNWYVSFGPFPTRSGDSWGPTLPVHRQYVFGFLGDKPVVGDWDGNKAAEPGVISQVPAPVTGLSRWFILAPNGVATLDYGFMTDTHVVGDWDGNGTDNVGVVRKGYSDGYLHWLLDTESNFGTRNDSHESERAFGRESANPAPIVGRWAFPEVSVWDGSFEVFNSQANAVSFGQTSYLGSRRIKTFSVRNNGNEILRTANLSVPTGFRVLDSLNDQIAPGQSDSFVVELDTASIGTRSGSITFQTNDGNEVFYSFPVTGLVIDDVRPTALLSISNLVNRGKTHHSFTVAYSDNHSINVSDIDNNDIQITGPLGFSQRAKFVSVTSSTDGTPRTATYTIEAPSWDYSFNGQYTVILVADQIHDLSGNAATGGILGSFAISIPKPAQNQLRPEFGVVIPGTINDWQFNLDRDEAHEVDVDYGFADDQVVVGNWNSALPKADFPGIARGISNGALCWALDRDGDADDESRFCFGLKGDTVRVADFNGDGFDDVAAIRPGNAVDPIVGRQPLNWYVSFGPFPIRSGDSWGPTLPVNRQYVFGFLGDKPVVGDWDGNKAAEPGVISQVPAPATGLSRWFILAPNGVATLDYGFMTDIHVVGDWDGDGTDNVGAVRKGFEDKLMHWFLDTESNFGNRNVNHELQGSFGREATNPIPVVGNWRLPEFSFLDGGTEVFGGQTLDFGRPLAGTMTVKNFQIVNAGNITLTLSGATIQGTGFSLINNLPTSLGPGKSTTVSIAFSDPTGISRGHAEFSVNSNDFNDSPFRLILRAGDNDGVDESGVISGVFNVTPSGAATYSLPIVVSPGTNGAQPNLSLNYNSQSGNGLVGVGWSLSGLSAITRCASTKAQDGIADAVDFDDSDRFCLDGQRLMVISGSYGNDSSEYRTERESFTKIVANGTQGHAPQSFTVWTPSGEIITYGATMDSRFEASGRSDVLIWSANQITDRYGNYWTIQYQENNVTGEHYPIRIDYTGNASAGLLPYASVKFQYEDRHDGSLGFVNGSRVTSTKRINKITSYYTDSIVREYRLTYQPNQLPDLSNLTSVTECGADGTCFQPLSFTWDGTTATDTFNIVPFVPPRQFDAGTDETDFLKGDLNGDGRTDLVKITRFGAQVWMAALNATFTTTQFVPWSGYVLGETNDYRIGDFNADGLADLAHFRNSILNTWFSRGDGTFDVRSMTLPFSMGDGRNVHVGDFDGDGRTDAAKFDQDEVKLAQSQGNGKYTTRRFTPWSGYDVHDATRFKPADINGDGRTDFLHFYGTYVNVWFGNSQGTFDVVRGPSVNVDNGHRLDLASIDNDSKSDLFFFRDDKIDIWQSRGDGTFEIRQYKPTTDFFIGNGGRAKVADFNGDGLSDIIRFYSDHVILFLYTGNFSFIKLDVPLWNGYALGDQEHFAIGDWDGDGAPDLLHLIGDFVNIWYSQYDVPRRITSIRSSNGFAISVNYQSVAESATSFSKGSGAQYPLMDVQQSLYVVSSYKSSNGIGGDRLTSFKYAGALFDLERHESLGFTRYEAIDQTTGISTITQFQVDRVCGCKDVSRSETRLLDGRLVSELNRKITIRNMGNNVYFSYPEKVTTKSYELDGTSTYSTTETATFDNFGNMTNLIRDSGDGFRQQTVNTYTNNASSWLIGLLINSRTVFQAISLPDDIRSITYVYAPGTRSLERENIQPDYPALTLITTFARDVFGNVTRVEARGNGAERARVVSMTFDFQGRFSDTLTNEMGHKFRWEIEPLLGNVIRETDPNQLATRFQYDSFGRQTREIRPDKTETAQGYGACGPAECPQNAVRYSIAVSSGNKPEKVYYDSLARPIRSENVGFAGQRIFVDRQFDAAGRVTQTSDPYFSTDVPQWTKVSYDVLSRPIGITAPGDRRSVMTYRGREVLSTNARQQTQILKRDARGQLISVTDALGGTVKFFYDAIGNLIRTIGADGSVTTIGYDVRGNRTRLVDPDLGRMEYRYNVFGEVIEQLDAKGQKQVFEYDQLGRLTKRTKPEGVSRWEYDVGQKAIGQLSRILGPNGYQYLISYDQFGRPATTSLVPTVGENAYTVTNTYDDFGRLKQLTYPSGFSVTYAYNEQGYLRDLKRADNQTVLWEAQKVNARGQLERQRLGNRLVTDKIFDVETGFLEEILTPEIQHMKFAYNELGSLTKRTDVQNNVSEVFRYDSLERISSSQVFQGTTPRPLVNVTYNAAGSIKTKSDVGTYSYPTAGARPHAVASIRNANGAITSQFQYDANGNQVVRNADPTKYNSFNQPTQIVSGNKEINFAYSPQRTRVKQWVYSAGALQSTKTYVDGLFEREVSGGQVTDRHYISAAGELIAIYERVNGAAGATKYIHKDHLGSVQSISGENGTLMETLNYDAWGKPRNGTTWAPVSAVQSSTDRGFTGHEHLEEVGLIHMNGRVYDPTLARFLSADPFLQDLTNSQNYDRYTYVFNNPLSATDPSGFFKISHITHPFEEAFDEVKDTIKDGADAVVEGIKDAGQAVADVAEDAVDVVGNALEDAGNFIEENKAPIIGVAVGVAAAIGATYAGAAIAGVTSAAFAATLPGAIVAGAAFGFGSGAGSTLAAGGELDDALEAGAIGAVVGGATAGAASAAGSLIGTSSSQVLAGGIRGYLQSGDLEGTVRGFAAGLVPVNLGMPGLFAANPLSNIVIQIGYNIVTGAIVGGSQGIISQVLGGLVNNVIGHGYGFVTNGFNAPEFINGGYYYGGLDGGGITIGSAMTISGPDTDLMLHEYAHLVNQTILGPFYLPVHIPSAFLENVLHVTGTGYMERIPFFPPERQYECFALCG